MTQADLWRWEAAKLRARAVLADDPETREQLLVFSQDCEAEARCRDGVERIEWRRA
jgi:hypothetical protein